MHAHKLDFNSMSKNVILLIVAITKRTKIKHFSNQRLLHDFIRKILSTLSTTKVFFFKSLTNKNKINVRHPSIRATTVDFRQARQPYHCTLRPPSLLPLCSTLQNPGKTAVLAVLPFVAALTLHCVKL